MLIIPVILEGFKHTYVRMHIYIFATHVGCDDVMTSSTHQDNHPGVVINRAKSGTGRLGRF